MLATEKRSSHCHVSIGAFVLLIMFLQPGLVRGQSETATTVELSRHDLHALIKEANTPEQYRTLESYYLGRQKKYEQAAQEEKDEWVRRQKTYAHIAVKFPSPVDSARNLYEYYADMASRMGAKAAFYGNKAK